MIDKQKLLQWIEKKEHVYSLEQEQEYLDESDIHYHQGAMKILSLLNLAVSSGEFEEEGG